MNVWSFGAYLFIIRYLVKFDWTRLNLDSKRFIISNKNLIEDLLGFFLVLLLFLARLINIFVLLSTN